ncbi:Clavaminate synthase-like protein [Dichomitus squalens]|nr:Clavaminate synthase-like protein [Dichomitus squalens]
MPGATLPAVTHYQRPPTTKEDLVWADLPIIDFSKVGTPEGRAELVPQVRDAMRTHGFLIVINHGWTQAQNNRIFDVADVPFTQVSEDEKKRFQTKTQETGTPEGYKLRRSWTVNNGVRDELEYYTFFGQSDHPEALQPFLPEYHEFARHNHYNVLYPVLRLLATGMELPEETFVDIHDFDETAVKYARFLKYHPRAEEEEVKADNVWLKGHTDIGTITVLWSQPISALQIMSPDGKWRWVRHIENALVVNIGDAMEMLTGGFYKATIHRVVQPPKDQRGFTRLGAFYFAMCNDDVKLVPFTDSPALQREGVVRKVEDRDAPTMRDWRKARSAAYGVSETKRKDDVVEEQIINGVVVKHYN